MRGKGEGAVYRVPADRKQPLKYWQGSIELPTHDGKRRRKVIRSKNKATLLAELESLRRELKKRGDLPTASTTVEQWFTHWMTVIVPNETRPKTAAGYHSVVWNHIVPALGPSTRLEKVTPTKIRAVHEAIIDKKLSSTYALNAHRVMSSSFEIALREGRIGQNPAKLVNAPRKALRAMDAFDLDEAIRVLEHVSVDPVLGARWATSLLTGARRGEVIGLERDRVGDELDLSWQLQRLKLTDKTGVPDVPSDFEYRHLTGGLYLTRPKSNAGWRIIPLVDPLRAILERHLASTPPNPYGLVFAPNGAPRDPDQDTADWKRVLQEVGIQKHVVLHGLRHTAVDLLYEAGVPEDLIMQIIGHSTRSTTRGYKRQGQDPRLEAAMRQFSDLFTKPALPTLEADAS